MFSDHHSPYRYIRSGFTNEKGKVVRKKGYSVRPWMEEGARWLKITLTHWHPSTTWVFLSAPLLLGEPHRRAQVTMSYAPPQNSFSWWWARPPDPLRAANGPFDFYILFWRTPTSLDPFECLWLTLSTSLRCCWTQALGNLAGYLSYSAQLRGKITALPADLKQDKVRVGDAQCSNLKG